MKKPEPSRRRKIWKRVGIGAAAMFACAVAVPFIFTTAFARYYAAKIGLQGLKIGSATLLPWGELRLHDVVLDETAETGGGAGKNLVTVATVRLGFAWTGLPSSKFTTITVEGLNATLRPAADVPVSLLRLILPKSDLGKSLASASGSDLPIWFDSLTVTGNVHVEGSPPWATASQMPANAMLPMRASVKMTGDRQSPMREIAANVGDVELSPTLPMIAARLHLATTADGLQATVDSVAVSNVTTSLDAEMLNKLGLTTLDAKAFSSRLDGLKIAGKISIGTDVTLNLTGEVRDLSGRLTTGDGTASIDHFYTEKTRIEGKWPAAAFKTATPAGLFRELTVAQTTCRWENSQAGDFRLTNAAADIVKNGAQLELTALEGMAWNTPLRASLAYDLTQRVPTRGFVRFNGIDAANAVARLPENLRRIMPAQMEGKFSARLFLNGTDAEKYTLRLELDAPEELRMRGMATASNLSVRADVLWNGHFDGLPEITNGRITADQVDAIALAAAGGAGPGGDSPMPVNKLRSDFSLSRGVIRGDLYADLPDGGLLGGEVLYTIKTQTLENATLSLDDLDASLLNKFLGPRWSLIGNEDVELQLSGTTSALKIGASLTASPENTLKYGDGTMVVSGAPTVNIHGHLDLTGQTATVDSIIIQSVNAQADAAMVRALRETLHPETDSALDHLLTLLKPGATIAFHDLNLGGHLLYGNALADATLTLNQFNLTTVGNPLNIEDATVSLSGKGPLNAATLAKELAISAGQLDAKKITLSEQVATNLTTKISAGAAETPGKATATDLRFNYASGTFTGTAEGSLLTGFAKTTLHFTGVDQAIVTAHLEPDTFRAEGRVTGDLTFRQGPKGLTGQITFDTDEPGKLRVARATSEKYFAPVAEAAAAASNGLMPPNFGKLVADILENYPYTKGHVVIHDGAKGMMIDLDYLRQPIAPGDPGWDVPMTIGGQAIRANVELNLQSHIESLKSIEDEFQRLVGGNMEISMPKE